MRVKAILFVVGLSLLIASCGGGTTTPPVTDPDTGKPEINDRIEQTLKDGKVSRLQLPADTLQLAQMLYAYAKALEAEQQARIKAIMPNGMPRYMPTNNKQLTVVNNQEVAQPLIVGDKGTSLAAISVIENGRAAVFGANILGEMDTRFKDFQPMFTSTLAWLIYGKASQALPTTMTVGIDGISAAIVVNGLKVLGVEASTQPCDLSAQQSCQVDLVITGVNGKPSTTRFANVRALMASGTPLLYLHNTGKNSTQSGDQVATALGLTAFPYGGTYWKDDKIETPRGVQANLNKTNQFSTILPLLKRLADGDFDSYNWKQCTQQNCNEVDVFKDDILAPVRRIKAGIDGYSQRGEGLFAQSQSRLYRLASVWADSYRQQIVYPVHHNQQPAAFQKAVLADAWVTYIRDNGVAQPDLGNFLSPKAAKLPVEAATQTVTVTLEQASGFTAVGRFAQPGVKLLATATKVGNASVSLRLNTQYSDSTHWGNNDGYKRPMYLSSPNMQLTPNVPMTLISPYGGNIELAYSGATPGQTVTLQLTGVAKQPFLDMTQGGSPTTYVQTLMRSPFEWTEIKTPGAEIHGLTVKMKQILNNKTYNGDGQKYLDELLTLVFQDVYQLAGYAPDTPGDYELTPGVAQFCNDNDWDCTDREIHRIPGVQHFNSDYEARCGSMCGGNPIDVAGAIGPRGWGTSHEMGHNQQTGDLNIYGNRSAEVSNNVFPFHKEWVMYHSASINFNNKQPRATYEAVFNNIKKCQKTAKPSDCMYQYLWEDDTYTARNAERVAFYMQWVLYWGDHVGQADRSWDIITLLYMNHRLLRAGSLDWNTGKGRLGYSSYANRDDVKGGNDTMLMALSYITQHDQTATFDLWGVTYSAKAATQVAIYPKEPAFVYVNSNNYDFTTAKKLTNIANLVWPYPKDDPKDK